MEIVTIDGMVEHDFRLSIEDMLRLDQVDEAVERLRGLLETCVGDGGVLPARFLQVTADYIEIGGWNRLGERLKDHDRARHPISAIGVTLADYRALGGPGIRDGRLAPFVKTFYFNDDAYPFSEATRADLLDGYSRDGFEWQGDYQATDATLSIRGIDDLYGAIVALEDRLLASAAPGEAEIRAGTIGACYVSVLIHQALRDVIRRKGLPRPLCVFAACDGVYPFFDAPVVGSDAYAPEEAYPHLVGAGELAPADDAESDDDPGDEPPGEASLLSLFSSPRTKAPVMVLCEEDALESERYSEMAGAQRLGIDDAHAPFTATDRIPEPPHAASADGEGDAGWGEADLLEPAATAAMPSRLDWVTSNLAAEDYVEEPAEATPDEAPAADGREEEPVAPPASHSLRTRIKLAEPDETDIFADRIKSFFARIMRSVFGR